MSDTNPYDILIVDNNPSFAKYLRQLIMDIGDSHIASVQYANNAVDGLILIRDNNFHFVFMDVDMPEPDGIMATRFATYEYNKPGMRIIAISFHSEQSFRTKMLRAGASDYLAKDEIDAEKLLEIFDMSIMSLSE